MEHAPAPLCVNQGGSRLNASRAVARAETRLRRGCVVYLWHKDAKPDCHACPAPVLPAGSQMACPAPRRMVKAPPPIRPSDRHATGISIATIARLSLIH